MCLRKTHVEPKIAQDDIEVWKVLTDDGLSPYLVYPYHPGMNKPSVQKMIPVEQMLISDGYLHAYRNKVKADKFLLDCMGTPWYIIHRMIIPKGTVYYEGDDGDVCSECLYWPEEETAATL